MNQKLTTVCAILATAWLTTGCGTEGDASGNQEASPEIGNLGLPLSSTSASGVEYRLRNADFNVWGFPQDCWEYDECDEYDESFSSEDYLEEPSIMLDLLEGDYEIYLGGEWSLERVVDGEAEPVEEAVLLNDPWQWVWVSPHSTSWVTFQFGIGDEELWLNGQVNIQMEVYEDPDEYYGGWECWDYCDEFGCWEECCREYCDEEGCYGECTIGNPGEPMPMPEYGEPTRASDSPT